MILGEDNRKRWSDIDVLIMNAYEAYEAERCSVCGRAIWLCRNDDPRLHVRVMEVHCYAKQELDAYDERHKDKKQPGISTYPEFYTRDDTPLIDFRERYYQRLHDESEGTSEEQD